MQTPLFWTPRRFAGPTTKPKFPTFFYNGQECRLVRRSVKEYDYGYLEPTLVTYNIRQVRLTRWRDVFANFFWHNSFTPRWRDVEFEEIPNHVLISLATVGHDCSQWHSTMLAKYQPLIDAAAGTPAP